MHCTDVFMSGVYIYIYMYAYLLCIQHMGIGSYNSLGKVIPELRGLLVQTTSYEVAEELFHFLKTPRTVSGGAPLAMRLHQTLLPGTNCYKTDKMSSSPTINRVFLR